MQSLHQCGARRWLLQSSSVSQVTTVRDASLTSAISRGIRKATGNVDRLGTYRRPRDADEDGNRGSASQSGRDRRPEASTRRPFVRGQDNNDFGRSPRSRHDHERQPFEPSRDKRETRQDDPHEQGGAILPGRDFRESRAARMSSNSTYTYDSRGIRQQFTPKSSTSSDRNANASHRRPVESQRPFQLPRSRFELERFEKAGSKSEARFQKDRLKRPFKPNIDEEAPQGVPYTTAGSQFVYGTFGVTAALEAGRRRLYKLYKWEGERSAEDEHDQSIAALAKSKNIPIQYVAGSWDKMLMKMSGQRPHNGYVLEASPVPMLPINALLPLQETSSDLTVQVAPQSLEDKAMNQTFAATAEEAVVPRSGSRSRFPLLLWLDQVTDTGNIGAIMRTAYYFGVDAIIIPEHGTAPFNPVTIKASAGAAEHVPVLIVKKEVAFVRASQENGWRFFAAVAPDSASTRKRTLGENVFLEHEALKNAPGVLMVGNEGSGLRSFLQHSANELVSIHGVQSLAKGVDSLNVSVAAALLMSRFLTEPPLISQQESEAPPSETAKSASIAQDGSTS